MSCIEETIRTMNANRVFYQLRPLTKHFGVEAAGIDMSSVDLTDQSFLQQLQQDLVQHRVLLFRKQNLSGQRQVDISCALGTVESTFYKHPKSPHLFDYKGRSTDCLLRIFRPVCGHQSLM